MKTEMIENVEFRYYNNDEFSELVENVEAVLEYCAGRMQHNTGIEIMAEDSDTDEIDADAYERFEVGLQRMNDAGKEMTNRDFLFVRDFLAVQRGPEVLTKKW